MPLLDELEPLPRNYPGSKCAIWHLRQTRGDKFAREVLDLISEPGWSIVEKAAVLSSHGLEYHRQFMDRHRRNDCQGCKRWRL